MTVRAQFAAQRGRSFTEAADDYVARVRDHQQEHHAPRAVALRRSVLRQLATGDRRHLVYRFAQFFALSRAAGIEPMHLCFEPPLFTSQVRRTYASAAPGWLEADALTDRANPGHRVFLATIPELCCFGFIAIEVATSVMLDWLGTSVDEAPAVSARRLNTDLTKALSTLSSSTALSDHEARALFALVRTLEQVAGGDFSLDALGDDHVLQAWVDLATTTGQTRFTVLMRQIAALSAEVDEAATAARVVGAFAIDDLAVDTDVERLPDRSAGLSAALSHPLIVELLSRADRRTAHQQLVEFAPIRGLNLSRARAMTFGPMEERVVQAKRDGRDLASVVAAGGATYAVTMDALAAAGARLQSFGRASVYLLWNVGRRLDALGLVRELGDLSPEEVRACLPAGLVLDRTAIDEATLAGTEPDGPLGRALETGRTAWYQLRRRKGFGGLEREAEPMDLTEAAGHAILLCRAVSELAGRLSAAVNTRRDGDAFAEEHQRFCAALGRVHGFMPGVEHAL